MLCVWVFGVCVVCVWGLLACVSGGSLGCVSDTDVALRGESIVEICVV